MHSRAAQLISTTLLRVEARLAQQALGMDQVPSMPVAQIVEVSPAEPIELEEAPQPETMPFDSFEDEPTPTRLLPPLAARIEAMAARGWTPQMAAHDLRLHPKRIRQIARDYNITFSFHR
ncbi:hypothetical protein NK553_14795 [Pseudomonas sp. ZM23]|uniref:Uncharacterized protein n=1 Tax=Pseudomonas triclosanedens TaxID=2961893 RepID=A0ABY6ZW20_9PSED|nr:hypothetical protein [Pseudomonas triclosanedens]MCP8465217.1 hypothetical protein [Pseudomonas triclosanedens]MCP8470843.1 hypothetical protein [Pseudomonas triclosanedens]MCP8476588.1 hypothetical protein [Pseudomonas triclosanedens]WAI49026.1 hypothetical protein OU419_25300 [Pseudomonas triclosanedens]